MPCLRLKIVKENQGQTSSGSAPSLESVCKRRYNESDAAEVSIFLTNPEKSTLV